MRDESLKRQAVQATIGFAVFIVLFTLLRDLLSGQPVNLAGSFFSGALGVVLFGGYFYVLLRRRGTTNGA